MKLSELIESLKIIDNACGSDPEVQLVYGEEGLQLDRAFVESTASIPMERGDLKEMPEWEETLIIYLDPT